MKEGYIIEYANGYCNFHNALLVFNYKSINKISMHFRSHINYFKRDTLVGAWKQKEEL